MTEDERHLKLLSIFHYVVAGLAGLFACIPILHLAIGIAFIVAPHKFTDDGELPPAWFGWIFVILASTLIAVGWVFAGFVFAVGRFLAKRKDYMFCLVVACIECMFMPFGTVLGVLTILTLTRDSVKQLFGGPLPAQTTPPPL